MKIEVARPFWYEGEIQPAGTELDVPDGLALELIALRKAVGVASAEKPKRGRPAKVAEPAAEPEVAE
jgi:hypothetical protein